MQTDEQRINILYDLLHLERNAAELTRSYDVNYNTVRNIQALFEQQAGITYKHQRMYTDINNPVLAAAVKIDANLKNNLSISSEPNDQDSHFNDP